MTIRMQPGFCNGHDLIVWRMSYWVHCVYWHLLAELAVQQKIFKSMRVTNESWSRNTIIHHNLRQFAICSMTQIRGDWPWAELDNVEALFSNLDNRVWAPEKAPKLKFDTWSRLFAPTAAATFHCAWPSSTSWKWMTTSSASQTPYASMQAAHWPSAM